MTAEAPAMKFDLIVNPASGKGRSVKAAQQAATVFRSAGHTANIFQGASAEDSERYLRDLESSDGVVVVGGDGLVHLAVQRLATSGIPLGIIPCGTGNDAARSLGIPLKQPEAAARLILESTLSTIDLGLAQNANEKRWFLQILSTGFDSVVNERANTYSWPHGTMKYNRAMATLLPRFRPISYRIKTTDTEQSFDAMLVAIANGPSYGGGMLVCPEASFKDGQLDLMILNPLGKFRFLALFPKVYRGSHISHPKVTTLRTSSLTIEGSASAYADGERVGSLPLQVSVARDALRVWAAKVP